MKHFIISTALLFATTTAANAQEELNTSLFKNVNKTEMSHWVDSVFDSLSEDERIGQLIMIIGQVQDTEKNRNKLNHIINNVHIGGVLYQKGNIHDQIKLCNMMQKNSKTPLLVSLDGEWGLSMRLSPTVRYPRNMMLGAIQNGDSLLTAYGKEIGRQCQEMGIHINFAPVLDVNSNTNNPVIGTRSFGENKELVARYGIRYSEGLESMNVLSTAKHFPGHGDTSEDSHLTLPALYHSRERLDSVELYPFKEFINKGLGGMMVAHLYVPAIDKTHQRATSMSPKAVDSLLKKELGFKGLCFTDGLAMKGAAGNSTMNTSVAALLAGNDILLGSDTPEKDFKAIKEALNNNTLSQQLIEEKCLKILRYKYALGLHRKQTLRTDSLEERINTPYSKWLAAKLNELAITIVKNEKDFLPLKNLDNRKIAVLTVGDDFEGEFKNTLQKYAPADCFKLTAKTSTAERKNIFDKLKKYDLVLCGIFTVRVPDGKDFKELAQKTDLVYSFFTSPYFCENYKESIQKSKAVVIGYENSIYSKRFAAEAIYGGIAAKGKLPVTIPNLFTAGTGIETVKTRLGYHLPEEVGIDSHALNQIDTIVNEGLKAKGYPGCYVLVAKDGNIIYEKPFGYTDYNYTQKVNDQTTYDLASSSKATGTLSAVMKAYDEKKFHLDDCISKHLPELKKSDKEDLKISELLYHESGVIPTILFYESAIDQESYKGSFFSSKKDALHPIRFTKNTYARTDYKFLSQYVSETPKEGFKRKIAKGLFVCDTFEHVILRDIAKSKLSKRGRYMYSCVNFIMLKLMVERIMKQPMDELLDKYFFNRLGAYSTTYHPLEKIDSNDIAPTEHDPFLRKQLLRGYVHDESAAFQGGVSGNAGLFSNANDLCKLLQLYLNNGIYGGERFLSETTCKLFTESKSAHNHRGLGFDKPYLPNPDYSNCGVLAPESVYGHTGFTGTCFWVDPDNNIIYIFLSNRVNPTRENYVQGRLNIRTRIQDAIYESIKKDSYLCK